MAAMHNQRLPVDGYEPGKDIRLLKNAEVMTTILRQVISNKLTEAVELANPTGITKWLKNSAKVPWSVRVAGVQKKSRPGRGQFLIYYNHLEKCDLVKAARFSEQRCWAQEVANKFQRTPLVNAIYVLDDALVVNVDWSHFTKLVLGEIVEQGNQYGLESSFHDFLSEKESGAVQDHVPNQTVVVEYSSPNIAKPFHAGHLRSTVLGNFVANINEGVGHKVVRINYLGDWGTQFGLLGIGFARYGSMEEFRKRGIHHLFEVYVKINKDAESDKGLQDEVADFVRCMEDGNNEALSFWQMCRDISIEEYSKMYERIGIKFDEYHGEAMYNKKSHDVVKEIGSRGLMETDSNTGVSFMDLSSADTPLHLYANLRRSDGSTLYITRDLSAAIDRWEKYKFDHMYYVVENGQFFHFKQLVQALRKLGYDWAKKDVDQFHIRFGRVEGMKTRKGQVVFLKDILDEAKTRMMEVMKEKNTTKIAPDKYETVADKLGISAIIVYDLKRERMKNYRFDWQAMLNFNGDTGVALQYVHARLCSMERNCGVEMDVNCSLDPLSEPEARLLIQHLSRYDEELQLSYIFLEPYYIVRYLFTLRHLTNAAYKELPVKDQPEKVAQARLLLFHCAKIVLANGLRLLGVEPLEEM